MTQTRIVVAGGGTAGHVNPLLATADELRRRGCTVEALGTQEGLESTLVPEAGFPLHTIARVPLPRKPSADLFTLPVRMSRAISESARVLQGAEVLVGFGGYVSTPAYFAARKLGVPVVIHEQNARPGLANRVGASQAAVVALTFPSTPLQAKKGQTVVTGLPLRAAIGDLVAARRSAEGAREARVAAAARLGVSPDVPTLLVTGGSLGALHINEAVAAAAADLPAGTQVIHLTGRGKDGAVREAVEAAGMADRWTIIEYLTTMEDALAVADLVLCRSGAGTVAEMTALGLPCCYVPLPIGNGEQKLNAADHVASGGALLVNDSDLTARVVSDDIFPLLTSPELQRMAEATRQLGRSDAVTLLADLVCDQAELSRQSKGGDHD